MSKNQACNSAICFSQPRSSATFGAQFLCGWGSKFQEEISLARSHTDFAAAANCKSFLVFIVLAPRLAFTPVHSLVRIGSLAGAIKHYPSANDW